MPNTDGNLDNSATAGAVPFDSQQAAKPATHFRKKPIVIEAYQFTGIPTTGNTPPKWLMAAVNSAFGDGLKVPGSTLCVGGVVSNFREQVLEIGTLEGVMTASKGDWIIKGIKGELYPCKPDIFAASYEVATDGKAADTPASAKSQSDVANKESPDMGL